MKILKYLPVIIAAISCLESCNLTLLPQDSLSPENYFQNETDLRLWTNSFYTMLESSDVADQNADDVVDSSFPDYLQGTRTPEKEGGWSWSKLRDINYYLEHSHNCTDESAREHFDGIAYFFRAYFYFVKVRRYGDVPYYTSVIGSTDEELLKKPRDSREHVMTQVMADFDKAIEVLPAGKDIARVNKWAALAFKSRAALYEGTFRKYHGIEGYDKYLRIAAEAAESVILNCGYTLNKKGPEPYRDLFNSDNANVDEVILARIYNDAIQIPNGIPHTLTNSHSGITKRMMNHYLTDKGEFFSSVNGYDKMTYAQETQNRDSRMAQTILCPGHMAVGESVKSVNLMSSHTGYQVIKYYSDAAHNTGQGNADFPLMRLAEVYLNYAEAKAELDDIDQHDLDISVNNLRERAGLPRLSLNEANTTLDPLMVKYYPNVTKSKNTGVILEIRRERTVELIYEGRRIWDLLRWKEGAQMMNTTAPYYGCYFPGTGVYDMDNDGRDDLEIYSDSSVSDLTVKLRLGSDIILSEQTSGYVVAYGDIELTWNEERDYLWPIPSDQRILTGGILSQNKGYNDNLNFE